jgi:hypothetical protein
MSSDVFANHFCRYFIAHRSGEVAAFPELAAPQLPFDLWKLSEDGSRRETLKPRYDLRYREAWRKRTEEMHMIGTNFHFIYRDVITFGYLSEHLGDSHPDCTCQNRLAVLG